MPGESHFLEGKRPTGQVNRRRTTTSFNLGETDRQVLEALAEYWGCSLSEAFRTMLRHFETTLKLDVRR